MAQWLEHWTFDQEVLGSNPVGVESFSAMPYFSSLRPSCRKNMYCIDIGIGKEWYGMASGIISFRNNIVMALDSCPKCIFAQYRKNE